MMGSQQNIFAHTSLDTDWNSIETSLEDKIGPELY